MDEMVLEVQKWLNDTYTGENGYSPIPEDGATGNTTVGALIVGLQIELGISPPVPTFGPTTSREFPGLGRQEDGAEPNNLIKILQGGFWCKGYNPGGFSGNFFGTTESRVREFEGDVGIDPTGFVTSKLMKAILNTDGFKPQGPEYLVRVQKLLNRNYSQYFDYIPTNGIYERKTNTALIYALQHEIGIGDIANGNYGPSTLANTPTLNPGNENRGQNRILQMSLAVNGYYQADLHGIYDSGVENAVQLFQDFMTLPANGIADPATIKQLLTSNGHTGRSAVACDASTIVDHAKAETLVNAGYEIIGRYLTGTVAGLRSKAMTHRELEILEEYGLRVFPIYQDGGATASYFNYDRGFSDGFKAIDAAERLGFGFGTTIYFAVDFDALGHHITNQILPYLRGVRNALNSTSGEAGINKYNLGVYGPRNVCIQAANDSGVYADYSFVANMSTGFSGNLGYPMPTNWAFGQFIELTIGSGDGAIGIDKNDYSGRDEGVSSVNPPQQDNERSILYDEMMDLGRSLPGFFIDPNVFGSSFSFNQTYPVLQSTFYNVLIETSLTYSLGGEGATYINVSNGTISYDLRDLIGNEFFGKLSASRRKEYEDQLSGLSATIGNGYIEFTTYMDGMKNVSKITAYKENIKIDELNRADLAVSVIFEVIPYSTPSTEFQTLRNWVLGGASIAGVALGAKHALTIIANVARYGGALGFAASTIALLMLGEIEEMEAEDE